jgi:L-alanine-DL-glutamate epimerase-like enolase superfamily enzyme
MGATLQDFTITRFRVPTRRVFGDSQVTARELYVGTLELHTEEGLTGTGFFGSLFPLPSQESLERSFAAEVAPVVIGSRPEELLHRVTEQRGENVRSDFFSSPLDTALWDLTAQHASLPLYRLLGGTENRVRAYSSGLDFPLSDEECLAFFAASKQAAFDGFKVKVGRPHVRDDIDRLQGIRGVIGADSTLMIDANEAWSAKEAVRRTTLFQEAGLDVYWLEDPCSRHDVAGMRLLRESLPSTLLNVGEYLSAPEVVNVLAERAVDIVNLSTSISDSLHCAHTAASLGIPVAIGNGFLDVGVHLGCALPGATWMEYSGIGWDVIVAEPVVVADGFAHASERPGHGLSVSDEARATYAVQED